jgi:transposase
VQRGYKFLTVVYQIDNGCRRLLWVGRDRTVKTMLRFFRELGKERSASLRFVCSDMWKPYLKVIAKKASQAIHVLDRFHIMAKMNKAIDEVRAQEAKELKAKGLGQVLKGTRWTLLKRPENRTLIFRSSPSPSSSAITFARCASICSARSSNSSGATSRPPGPGGSSTAGAPGPCV